MDAFLLREEIVNHYKENRDFKDYVELISTYYLSKKLYKRDWNQI